MKGRRKLKTIKWELKANLIRQAKAILNSESHLKRSGRLIDRSASIERRAEPVGILAGNVFN